MSEKRSLALVVNSQPIIVDVTQIGLYLRQLYQDIITKYYPKLSEPPSKKDPDIIITEYEVIKLIWRSISEQINQQPLFVPFGSLKETNSALLKHLKQYEKSFLTEIPSIDNKLKYQLEQIKSQISNLILDSKNEKIQEQHDNMMADITSYLEDCIAKTQKRLFVESLCGIRQLEDSSLQFKFELSYPTITYQEDEAIQMLGKTLIENKKRVYQKYFKKYFLEGDKALMFFCHYCQSPCPIKYFKCSNDNANPNFPSCVLIDPYMYYRRILSRQLYDNERNSQIYFHAFEKYHQNKNKYSCNRVVCQKCKDNDLPDKKQFKTEKFECGFCLGICSCCRCKYHQDLVKLMGLYLHFGGELNKVIENFVFKFCDNDNIEKIPFDKLNAKQEISKNELNKVVQSLMKFGIFRPLKDIKTKQCFYISSKFQPLAQDQDQQSKKNQMRKQRKKDRIKAKRLRQSEVVRVGEFPADINNFQLEERNEDNIFYNDESQSSFKVFSSEGS